MTIPVSAAELPSVLTRFEFATLITHHHPYVKILAVNPRTEGEAVVIDGIRESTRAHIAADPHVTIVWQQHAYHGWTLIVDGIARTDGIDRADDVLRVTVESAMLHRPRAHADGPAWER